MNTKALSLAGLLTSGINHPGILLDDDGLPTGELKGPEVIMSVAGYVGFDRSLTDADAQGLQDFPKLCVRAGVTTVTDLASRLSDETVEMMEKVTSAEDFPARLVPIKFFIGLSPKDLVARVRKLAKRSTDRLRLGKIKIIADGSIQGFSARMRWPGYYNGAPNGLWYITPEQLSEIYHLALQAAVRYTPIPMAIKPLTWRWKCLAQPSRRTPIATTALPCNIANWPIAPNFARCGLWVCA